MCDTTQQGRSVPDGQIQEMKQCRGECGETKPLTHFPKQNKDEYRNFCKSCWNDKRRGKAKKYNTKYEHPELMFKVCKKCGNEKDFTQFNECYYLKDGRENICKFCKKPPKKDLYIDDELARECTGSCGEIKVISEFHCGKNGKYTSICKICIEEQEKTYKSRLEIINRNAQRNAEFRHKNSSELANLNLPELSWNKNERCPWNDAGEIFDVEAAWNSGISHIVYVLVVRDGKGIVSDNSKYAGFTNIITDKWKSYVGRTCNSKFKEFLKNNGNNIERHVIAICQNKSEAAKIEQDLLAHDDGTGIARWRPERTDWLNLHPGGQATQGVFNPIITEDLIKRFENKINRNGTQTEYVDTPCWEWTGSCIKAGYGVIGIKEKNFRASRLSLIIYKNHVFVENEFANHLCHNRKCVNPDHLYAGTAKDNVRDMEKSGRRAVLKGKDNPNTKLTWAKVREIRRKYATGNYTQERLGEIYGIAQAYVGQLVRNERWIE